MSDRDDLADEADTDSAEDEYDEEDWDSLTYSKAALSGTLAGIAVVGVGWLIKLLAG
jgi:hypothetical protein